MPEVGSCISIFSQTPSAARKLAGYLKDEGAVCRTYGFPDPVKSRSAKENPGAVEDLRVYIVENPEEWESVFSVLKKAGVSAAGSAIVLADEALCRSWEKGDTPGEALVFSKPRTAAQWRGWAKRIALMAKERRRPTADHADPEKEPIPSAGRFVLPSLISDFHKALSLIQQRLDVLTPTLDDASPVHRQISGINTLVRYTLGITEKMRQLCEAGEGEVNVFDLNGVIREAAGFLEQIAHPRQVFRFELHPEPLEMEGDRIQILRAVSGVIVNALEAMPNGGAIHIRSGRTDTDGSAEGSSDRGQTGTIWVAIQDQGPGMKPSQRKRIFEPHYTTKAKATHTGLGLTSVKSVVSEHGGTVGCETQAGRGATFTLRFPPAAKTDHPEAPKRGEKGVVLLVDPEPLVRSTTRRLLEHGGFHVMDASTAREGRELYFEHRHEVDLVLIDAASADISPDKAVRELKEINPQVRVLMSSGMSTTLDLERETNEENVGFIRKPFRMRELFAKVEEIMQAKGSPI